MAAILVVDDERNTRDSIEVILQREAHQVTTMASGEAALAHLATHEVDLVISDVRMPGMDGLTLLRRVTSQNIGTVVVMMSGHQDVTVAVEAIKDGAFDYLVKPFGKSEILRSVQKALTLRAVLVENITLKRQVEEPFAQANIIGSSPAWREVCRTIEQVAPSRSTVLVSGESGTGKELVAHVLHRLSPRAERAFVTLNAAALPESLVEAELFGYEKGAFTGAMQRKPGRFEMADGGTLFLDEIGELPPAAQAKLLRVLQEGTFERLGGTRTQKVDVRIVAATNRNLFQEVSDKRFREDLYYRINVIAIDLPSLRERRDDIPLLLAYFLRKYAQQNGKEIAAAQQEVIQRLQAYDWPGNVRELENVVERAVVLAQGDTIRVADLPPDLQAIEPQEGVSRTFIFPPDATLSDIEREAISQALQQQHGNRKAAARRLGIGLATLYRKLNEYHLH
jgi:two-component system, NtrC family, response regulator HydG